MAENRKKRLINKKFQLKFSLKLMLLSILPVLIILGIILLFNYEAEQKLLKGLQELNEAVKTEDNIVQAYLEVARVYKDRDIRLAAQNVQTDHEKSIKVITEYMEKIEKQIQYIRYIIYVIACILLLHIIFFIRYIIRYTHRISGPVYLMSKIIKAMLENRDIEFRMLRKKDEFKDIYNDLLKLNQKIDRMRSGR